MKILRRIVVEREFVAAPPARLGVALQTASGWKFHPAIPHRQPSRHPYRNFADCLPSWTGYPNGCSSREEPVPDVTETLENPAWNLRAKVNHYPDGHYEVDVRTIKPGAFDQLKPPRRFHSLDTAVKHAKTVLGLDP